jgi:hypothetical protein
MILIDREDVIHLNMARWSYTCFFVHWDPNDPVAFQRGQELDFPDILADGPFLCVVTDEDVWAGQELDHLSPVVQKRADSINLRQWRYLADLYAAEMGISRQSFVLRFAAMSKYLRGDRRGQWNPWDDVYHWPEGGDLAWSSLMYGHHPWMEVREHDGQRQVRYTP